MKFIEFNRKFNDRFQIGHVVVDDLVVNTSFAILFDVFNHCCLFRATFFCIRHNIKFERCRLSVQHFLLPQCSTIRCLCACTIINFVGFHLLNQIGAKFYFDWKFPLLLLIAKKKIIMKSTNFRWCFVCLKMQNGEREREKNTLNNCKFQPGDKQNLITCYYFCHKTNQS